ncbi:MAG: hypothetical protein M9892_05625 [Bacteroidetes bacterium]|nr:hypothetical protein [Bacteroidota bacterium]
MKTNPIYLFSLLLLLVFSSLRCNKDDDGIFKQKRPTELPPITTEGKNTFGCLVDGELLVPYPRKAIKDNFEGLYYSGVWGDEHHGSFHMFAAMDGIQGHESKVINIRLFNRVFDVGEYLLFNDSLNSGNTNTTDYNNASLRVYDEKGKSTFESWRVPNPNSGRLNILRLDTLNRIMAGTFYFDAVNKEGDTIKVTDGRFDLKY